MISCPKCTKGLTAGEYFFARGVRDPSTSLVREFGFYTCPNCRAVSAKPRVVLHAWGQAIVAVLGLTGIIPVWAWGGAAGALFAIAITRPKLVLLPPVPQ